MARRSLPGKPKPQMRNILVELPEDRVLALQKRAAAEQLTVHELVTNILLDAL